MSKLPESPAVPTDDLSRLRAELDESKSLLREERDRNSKLLSLVESSGSRDRNPPPAPLPEDDFQGLTEDEINEAMGTGKLAEAINRAIKINAARSATNILREFKEKEYNPFVNDGVSSLRALNLRTSRVDIPDLPEFEDEVMEAMKSLPASLQAKPEGLALAAQFVRGKPENVKKLIEKEVAAVRQKLLDEGALVTGTGGYGRQDYHEDLSPEALLKAGYIDRDSLKIIRDQGGPEAFAQKASRGRKDWNKFARSLIRAHGGEPPMEDADE